MHMRRTGFIMKHNKQPFGFALVGFEEGMTGEKSQGNRKIFGIYKYVLGELKGIAVSTRDGS